MNGFSFGEYSSFRRLIEVFMGLSIYTKPLRLLCVSDAGKCLFYFAYAKPGYHTSEENNIFSLDVAISSLDVRISSLAIQQNKGFCAFPFLTLI